jgi:hypothetical protein
VEMLGLALAVAAVVWLISRMPWCAFDFVVIGAAVAWAMLLPRQAFAAAALLCEFACQWWFWVLILLLYFLGLIPFTEGFAIRRAFQALDRMHRRQFGQWRRPSWAATVWLALLTAFAGRLFGWWGV